MLSVNFTNCLVGSIGVEHGLAEHDLFGLETRLKDAYGNVLRQANAGKLGFIDLPNHTDEAKKIMAWARKVRGSFDTLVVLGIGGSALGPTAVQQALRPAYWNLSDKKARKGWLRLFVFDNVDPRWAADLAATIDPRKTLFNVISKSGTTAESLAAYFIFRKAVEAKVGAKKAASHFVMTTDAQKGYLRELATRENMASFVVPGNVGGRFSVLTPVGLVPAALTGVNLVELLNGAKAMRARCVRPVRRIRIRPPSMQESNISTIINAGVKMSVMLPYSQNLYTASGDWYRQLWAESLGRNLTVMAAPSTPVQPPSRPWE